MRRPTRACIHTRKIEHAAAAGSIAGRAVTSAAVKNNASRMALPLTYWAVTAAAQNIATVMAREVELITPV